MHQAAADRIGLSSTFPLCDLVNFVVKDLEAVAKIHYQRM